MSDREALAAALEDFEPGWSMNLDALYYAARERLAQLPEKCGTCDGNGAIQVGDAFPYCPTCRGSGKVYPAELVFTVMNVGALPESLAAAVLDALNGETP